MTPREAFLAAIIAEPTDNALRLVFADWLEEQGEGERAEFIRVQCELARIAQHKPTGTSVAIGRFPWLDYRERRDELVRREGHFLVRPGVTYGPPGVGAFSHCDRVIFRRGFVAHVTLTAADWLAHADALTTSQPIEEVTLTTWPDVVSIRNQDGLYEPRLAGRLAPDEEVFGKFISDFTTVSTHALQREWPRIKFALPPIGIDPNWGDATANIADTIRGIQKRMPTGPARVSFDGVDLGQTVRPPRIRS